MGRGSLGRGYCVVACSFQGRKRGGGKRRQILSLSIPSRRLARIFATHPGWSLDFPESMVAIIELKPQSRR